MNSRYFNHSVLIMTCILVQVRHIPASWRRASVSWLRDTSARSQTNQTIFQFIFHIYIKSTQKQTGNFSNLRVSSCCTESPECCSRCRMKIWIPAQDTMIGGPMWFHVKSNFVCMGALSFAIKIAFLAQTGAQEMRMFVRSSVSNLSRAVNLHHSGSNLQAISQE